MLTASIGGHMQNYRSPSRSLSYINGCINAPAQASISTMTPLTKVCIRQQLVGITGPAVAFSFLPISYACMIRH